MLKKLTDWQLTHSAGLPPEEHAKRRALASQIRNAARLRRPFSAQFPADEDHAEGFTVLLSGAWMEKGIMQLSTPRSTERRDLQSRIVVRNFEGVIAWPETSLPIQAAT